MNFLLQSRRQAGQVAVAVLLVLAGPSAMAQVYKCQSPQGGTEYRSIPCDWSASQQVVQGGRSSATRAPVQTAALRNADADEPQRQAEARLQRSCSELQARASAAQRVIAGVERSLRETGSRGANDSAEIQRATQQERYRIASAQRQAEADQCEKVGIVVGSASAATAIDERDCKALRDELAQWEGGRGRTAVDAPLRALAAREQLQTRGCKAA